MSLHIASSPSYSLPTIPAANSSAVAQTRARRLDDVREQRPEGDNEVRRRGWERRPESGRRADRGDRGAGLRQSEGGAAVSFSGIRGEYSSGEQAALEVKTDDGDTVSISFAALSRIEVGAYTASAEADGAAASAQTYSAQSSVNVNVKVEGTLDEEEVKQIGDLLQRLVTDSRNESPEQVTLLRRWIADGAPNN